jgi:hypothetical protein
MGGKRPDQHNIDPAEAGATDHKNLPQTGIGNSNLDDTVKLDRQLVARSEHEAHEFPGRGRSVPPGRDANRALQEENEAEREGRDEVARAKPGQNDSRP